MLTERQKEVLRYRKEGLTQQEIADIIKTSKANVCTIERLAMDNIRKAREAIDFYYSLDSHHLCSIETDSDISDSIEEIYRKAEEIGIKVKFDSIQLMARIRDSHPDRFQHRRVKKPIEIYLSNDGFIYTA